MMKEMMTTVPAMAITTFCQLKLVEKRLEKNSKELRLRVVSNFGISR